MKTYQDLQRRLLETFTPEGALTWLFTHNPYLGQRTPAYVLGSGDIDWLFDALDALNGGVVV